MGCNFGLVFGSLPEQCRMEGFNIIVDRGSITLVFVITNFKFVDGVLNHVFVTIGRSKTGKVMDIIVQRYGWIVWIFMRVIFFVKQIWLAFNWHKSIFYFGSGIAMTTNMPARSRLTIMMPWMVWREIQMLSIGRRLVLGQHLGLLLRSKRIKKIKWVFTFGSGKD